MINLVRLILSLTIPLAAGSISGALIAGDVNGWYQQIQKPDWNPPDWLFAPVWTLLYILMGIAVYLVWRLRTGRAAQTPAMVLFSLQLVLNLWWSLIFFRYRAMGWAFAEIVVLWLLIFATILAFARISKAAAWLLVPYISWVSFAAVLNYTIWSLN